MSLFFLLKSSAKAVVVAAAMLAWSRMAYGDGLLTCRHKCPPPYVHCQEGPPRIRIKCGCPKTVCDPCTLEHYGYYQTCWRPWSFGADFSHCPVPPPAVQLGTPASMPPLEPHRMPPERSMPETKPTCGTESNRRPPQ